MAATAVTITLADIDNFLQASKGWRVHVPTWKCKEHVRDFALSARPGVVVRVYSSIDIATGVSRPVGGDAIRVCAVDTVRDRGIVATRRVHRVANWRENLRERVLEVLREAHDRTPAPAPAATAKVVQAAVVTAASAASTQTSTQAAHPAHAALMAVLKQGRDAGIQYPKLRIPTEHGKLVVALAPAVGTKHPDSMTLTDGKPFGANTYYGRIMADGTPLRAFAWTQAKWVDETLAAFAADPAAFAAASGKKAGICCFCGRHLETKESVEAGYGPICAEKFHLPWGVAACKAEGAEVAS